MKVKVKPGDLWAFEIQSSAPVTPQQFFAMVSEIQAEGGESDSPYDVVSSTPIDSTHSRVIVKWRAAVDELNDVSTSNSEGRNPSFTLNGITFTVTAFKPYTELRIPVWGDYAWLTTAIGLTAVGALIAVPTAAGVKLAKKHPGTGGAVGALAGVGAVVGILMFLGQK